MLTKDFFIRSGFDVAKDILGKHLVIQKKSGAITSHIITEVEVYDGFKDTASHAVHGKTNRNAPMFEQGGIWYVYLIYGMYNMLTIVTADSEYPSAVLLRGVEGADGPGKLTKQLRITRRYNGKVADHTTGLWMEDRGITISKNNIKKSPRIGIEYAGPIWSKKLFRFFIEGVIQ
jgi:DNA-3-methyladenine glycosylase